MNTINSLAAASGQLTVEATLGSLSRSEGEKLPFFRREDILAEPNRADEDQTQVFQVNGTSNALRINLGQFLLSSPAVLEPREFFQAMQKWEGHVIEVSRDTFRARIAPIVGEGPDQEAEIYIEEVAEDDRILIEPGAVFYWSIGYLDKPSGRLRASVLRFRRLPTWTRRELEKADAEANRLRGLFDAE